MGLSRHQLVWLDVSRTDALHVPNDVDRSAAESWLRSHPAIVRRCETGIERGVALGIPLPSRLGRKRIALFAMESSIVRTGHVPLLADALPSAPAEWRQILQAADSKLRLCGASVRAYGSLGWQHVTGEHYLHPQSDIDLLITPDAGFDSAPAVGAFRDLAACGVPRFDGELMIGADRAVAWREFDTPAPDIMVRSRTGVTLEAKSAVLENQSPVAA